MAQRPTGLRRFHEVLVSQRKEMLCWRTIKRAHVPWKVQIVFIDDREVLNDIHTALTQACLHR